MAITAFRQFANHLRQPAPYFPGITELKGATNLLLGSMQLLISIYMRCSTNPHHRSLTQKHIAIGTEAVRRGLIQFAPGFLAGMGARYATNYYYNATQLNEPKPLDAAVWANPQYTPNLKKDV